MKTAGILLIYDYNPWLFDLLVGIHRLQGYDHGTNLTRIYLRYMIKPIYIHTLWLFNIAMEKLPIDRWFTVLKNGGSFHGYVSHNQMVYIYIHWYLKYVAYVTHLLKAQWIGYPGYDPTLPVYLLLLKRYVCFCPIPTDSQLFRISIGSISIYIYSIIYYIII